MLSFSKISFLGLYLHVVNINIHNLEDFPSSQEISASFESLSPEALLVPSLNNFASSICLISPHSPKSNVDPWNCRPGPLIHGD